MSGILIADSDKSIRAILQCLSVQRLGLKVDLASDKSELMEQLSTNNKNYDLIIFDAGLDEKNGSEILEYIRLRGYDVVTILLYEPSEDPELIVKARNLGAYDFVKKPIDIEKFRIVLENALKIKKLYNQINLFSSLLSNNKIRDYFVPKNLYVELLDNNGILRKFEDLERDIINKAIEFHNGKISETARKLGVGRSTIYRKIDVNGLKALEFSES